ncbi:MAG: alpha/beta fold hydrolase [Patescibacteria group bacterium]
MDVLFKHLSGNSSRIIQQIPTLKLAVFRRFLLSLILVLLISLPRIVHAQTTPYSLTDNATGGDCILFGTWDEETKTCTMNTDVNVPIVISNDDITLNGNGYRLIGTGGDTGISITSRTGVSVEHITIIGYWSGILVDTSSSIRLSDIIVNDSMMSYAVSFINTHHSTLESSTITSSTQSQSVRVIQSDDNIFNQIIILTGNPAVFLNDAHHNEFTHSTFSTYAIAVQFISSHDNSFKGNEFIGTGVRSSYGTVLNFSNGNVFTENTIQNMYYNLSVNGTPQSQAPNRWYHNNFINYINRGYVVYGSGTNLFSEPLPIGGNYWDQYDEPIEGCYDRNGDLMCDGGYVIGADVIDCGPWIERDVWKARKDPVILIPGISGSKLFHNDEEIWMNVGKIITDIGDEFLDVLSMDDGGQSVNDIEVGDIIRMKDFIFPIPDFIVWSNLIEDLQNAGYIENQTLFVFPYDWRMDNSITAEALQAFITSVLQQTSSPKADLITHSMGGLVAKQYISQYGETSVDQLIFIGTPHYGAPKALKTLLWGDQFSIPGVLNPSAVKDISRNMSSIYQLLPSLSYFSEYDTYFVDRADIDHDGVTGVLDFNQTQSLIGNMGLNTALRDDAIPFHASLDAWTPSPGLQPRVHNIIGCGTGTPGLYLTFQDSSGKTAVYYQTTDGDETVPLHSARKVAAGSLYYIPRPSHARMPDHSLIRSLILDILSDNTIDLQHDNYEDIRAGAGNCGFTATMHRVYSPVNLNAYDALGNHTGLNPEGGIDEEIPGSRYDVLGDDKFLFLPKGSNAAVTLDGIDNGTFRYDIADVTQDGELQSARFFDLPVTPDTRVEVVFDENHIDQTTLKLDLQGDGTYEQILSPSSFLDVEGSADFISPHMTVVSPLPDAIFEHHQTLPIQSEIIDDTAPLAAVVKIDGHTISGQSSSISPFPLSLFLDLPTLLLGTHTLSFTAHDAAGNYTSSSSSFTIIATPSSVVGLLNWGLTHNWYPDPKAYAAIKKALELIPPLPNPPQPLSPKQKQVVTTIINNAITIIERSYQQGRITLEARDMLVGDLVYIKASL